MSQAVRFTNFIKLLEKSGNNKIFAEQVGMNSDYVSHIKGKRRPIGDELARRIEKALGKPDKWLDVSH